MITEETPEKVVREEYARLYTILEDLLVAISAVGTSITIPGSVKILPEVHRQNKIGELRAEAARNLGVFAMERYGLIAKGTDDCMNLVETYKLFIFNPNAQEPPLDIDKLMIEFGVKREQHAEGGSLDG